jgi:hypothetical protein
VEAWWSGDLAGLPPWGPGGEGTSLQNGCLGSLWGRDPAEQRSGGPTWSWGIVGMRGGGPAERSSGWWAYGAGAWPASCSFSKSWHGEDFHKLGVQSAEVSALLGALPLPRVSPASQQGP